MTTQSQSQTKKTTEKTKAAEKLTYQPPVVEVIGRMEELTGSCGRNNSDGWGHNKMP